VADLADYLELTVGQAREQFRALLARRPVPIGRQVTFLPVETLLCLAASFLVNHRRFGGTTAHQAPEPVPSLARLFTRPPSSVLAKMANLDGSRSHGARWDVLAGAMLRGDPARFTGAYRVLLHAARAEGIGPGRLPDFLELEHSGELTLLGQDELDSSALEASLRDQITRHAAGSAWSEQQTERILLAAARVGQHVFALHVLRNCGSRCVFCGLTPQRSTPGAACCWRAISSRGRTARRASASIPATGWPPAPPTTRRSTPACSPSTAGCASTSRARWPTPSGADPLARQYYGRPPLRETLILLPDAQAPARKYLDWHRQNVFVA
jgi:putative restriction endonuclease